MILASATPASIRLLILSDLHIEFATFKTPDPALYDIAVLAGDVAVGTQSVIWARRKSTFGGKPVILVAGNHEFYGSERTHMLEMLRQQAKGSNVHFLDRDEVVVQGVRFLGPTLWTDFEVGLPRGTSIEQAMRDAKHGLNDFCGSIRERVLDASGRRPFTPQHAAREHRLSRDWLRDRLGEAARVDPSGGVPTVVVTHHAPSSLSMDPMYEGSELNPCYYSELPTSLFQRAVLWVHGHIHTSSDYQHHATRVVANPRGYVRWNGTIENERFDPVLVVQLAGGRDAD